MQLKLAWPIPMAIKRIPNDRNAETFLMVGMKAQLMCTPCNGNEFNPCSSILNR